MTHSIRVLAIREQLEAHGHHVTPDGRMRPRAAAYLLGVSEQTLRKWRCENVGPAYYKYGSVWYRIDDLLSRIDQSRIEPA